MTTSHDNSDLLRAARDGDDDALGELLENFRPMLRGDAMKTLTAARARVDASDLVQMTWWSAFRAFPRFEGDVDLFIAWLRTIHKRNLRDVVRDQHAEKRALNREIDGHRILPMAAGRSTSPSQRACRNEETAKMEVCLNRLPAAQREAVRLRFYEGLGIAEIVQRMGRSETAVAGLVKRGLSQLRQLMDTESRTEQQHGKAENSGMGHS